MKLNFLGDLKNLLKWDVDIATVEVVNEITEITRMNQSLNDKEMIEVEQSDNLVIYHCKGNRLDYQVKFEVSEEVGILQIEETLLLPEMASTHLPLKLLKPITKHAFATKLDQLVMSIA